MRTLSRINKVLLFLSLHGANRLAETASVSSGSRGYPTLDRRDASLLDAPQWVTRRHRSASTRGPLYPQKRTSFTVASMSALSGAPIAPRAGHVRFCPRLVRQMRTQHAFSARQRVSVIAPGKRLVRDLSHFNRRPRILYRCRAHSPHQPQFCCRCCKPSRSPHQQTSGITIGMATDSSLAITSRLITTCQFMAPKERSAELQIMCRATGTVAGITTSAIPGFSAAVITAAVLAHAGLGRPSGRCGIAGNSGRLWVNSGHRIDRDIAFCHERTHTLQQYPPNRIASGAVTQKPRRTNFSVQWRLRQGAPQKETPSLVRNTGRGWGVRCLT